MVLSNGLARLGHCSIQLVVRFTHQDRQLFESGQQSVVVLCELLHLIASMLQLCSKNSVLLMGVLKAILKMLRLHAIYQLELAMMR